MSKRNPWIYIPTLYFAEGLPYTAVMLMSVVYFKDIGIDNKLIGLTSALQFPWIFKFVWAPLIDFFGFKKKWIVVAQMVLGVFFALLGATTMAPDPFKTGVIVMAILAFASATHDAAIDGYYMEALDKPKQALFVGVRNTAFRLSMIFGTGGMVYLAGHLSKEMGKNMAWMVAFEIIAAVMLLAFVVHALYLPSKETRSLEPEELTEAVPSKAVAHAVAGASSAASGSTGGADTISGASGRPSISSENNESDSVSVSSDPDSKNYFKAIFSYFAQPGIIAIVCYILTFRLGDALVMKMIPPFLQDPSAKGGLGLSVEEVGTIYGTVGVGFLLLGGIVGGWLVSKFGLKKTFWPATLVMNGTILLYWALAMTHPSSLSWVYVVNSLEQFGYGFGMAAYTVFLLSTVDEKYRSAHYAVATAMMALGLMLPGMASGYIYEAVGYANFFLLSFALTLPGIISICFLPLWKKDRTQLVST